MAATTPERELDQELLHHYSRIRACYVVEFRQFTRRTKGYDPDSYGAKKMPVWDGGRDDNGRTHKAVWPQMAGFASAHGVCPFDLIRAVFFNWHSTQYAPTPRHIMSSFGLDLLTTFRAAKAKSLQVDVSSARSILAAELSAALRSAPPHYPREQVVVSVIADRSNANVLIKYCAAVACGAGGLAWGMRHQAAIEYLSYPKEWDLALGEHLPGDFIEYAREYVLPLLNRD